MVKKGELHDTGAQKGIIKSPDGKNERHLGGRTVVTSVLQGGR